MLDWRGQTAIVLASGPSLDERQCALAEGSGHRTIAVNATFRRLKPTIVYMGDMMAIKHYAAEVRAREVDAWTQDKNGAERYRWNHVKGVNGEGLCTKPGIIHLNGNSGAQAVNLAFAFGARRILLVGFDMQLGSNRERHHHEDHPRPMVQAQCFGEWVLKFVKLARDLEREGCVVVNCSARTALTCFPVEDLETELKT